ncbi:hypothetical protein [Streptomyces olivaceus]|uniref:hypothetical protein n=1 Tax=Streptomyces olivaceus TaxID=47716 RepID=UPI0022EDA84F|nr:hypothetical protein TPA0905_11230 [Streptomyces olivaceus]
MAKVTQPMRGVPGLDSPKRIALMEVISIDANCRAGIAARRAHVTSGLRKLLMLGLTEQWETALDDRPVMSPTSRVHLLGELLCAREESRVLADHRCIAGAAST